MIIEPPQRSLEKAKIMLTQVKQSRSVVPSQVILEIIETTIIYKFPNLSREDIAKMLGLVELQETRVYQQVLEDGRKEGKQEGIQEGLQRGKQQEASQLILKLLQRKVGKLSSQIQQQIENLSLEKLEVLGEALLDFNSLDNLIDWLNNNLD